MCGSGSKVTEVPGLCKSHRPPKRSIVVLESARHRGHILNSCRKMRLMKLAALIVGACITATAASGGPGSSKSDKASHDWPVYGGTAANNNFSPIDKIN